MKHSKKKKTLLGIGTALLPAAVQFMFGGQTIRGGVLALMAVACFVGYDYLDDKTKAQVATSVSPKDARAAAEVIADAVKQSDEALARVQEVASGMGTERDSGQSGNGNEQ